MSHKPRSYSTTSRLRREPARLQVEGAAYSIVVALAEAQEALMVADQVALRAQALLTEGCRLAAWAEEAQRHGQQTTAFLVMQRLRGVLERLNALQTTAFAHADRARRTHLPQARASAHQIIAVVAPSPNGDGQEAA